jgi:hypothetical protein
MNVFFPDTLLALSLFRHLGQASPLARWLMLAHLGYLEVGAQARLEADLVGILVSDPRDGLLVHQQALQRAARMLGCEANEDVRREVLAQRVDTEVVESTLGEAAVLDQVDDPAATRSEPQLATGRELKPDLRILSEPMWNTRLASDRKRTTM